MTFPPTLNNFNDAPNPIVVKKANIKKFCINDESNLILTILKESKIATKIAKIKQENKEAINKLALKHDAIIDNVTTNNILIHLNKRSKKATVL